MELQTAAHAVVVFVGIALPDRLDLKVERDQAEDEALEILHQIVHDSQTFGVLAVLHID